MATTICSTALMPRIDATAAQTGAVGMRSIHVAEPFSLSLVGEDDELPRHQDQDDLDQNRRGNVGQLSGAAPDERGRKRMVMLLRSTIATGMQQATANAATRWPASRTTSIGLAKKNRSNPSAIVITAKHSSTPRPKTASARASALVAQVDPCHCRFRSAASIIGSA